MPLSWLAFDSVFQYSFLTSAIDIVVSHDASFCIVPVFQFVSLVFVVCQLCTLLSASVFRVDDVAEACGSDSDASGVGACVAYPEDFLIDMPCDRLCDRLNEILARRGRSTGADAQIWIESELSLYVSGYSYHSQADLYSCGNPQWICVPCLII